MKPIRLTVLSLCLAFATFRAEAETWPAKPIKAVVPFAAGSLTDIVPRLVFEQLSPVLAGTGAWALRGVSRA